MSGGPFSVLQRIACEWAIRSFGMKHVGEPQVRSIRCAEEAIELCQAFDVPKEQLLLCVDNVYSRPKGEPIQEIGGVLMTTAVLCEAIGVEAELVLEKEVRRVLAKPADHWAKRNQEKLDVGLDGGVDLKEHVFESYRDPEHPEKVKCTIDGKPVSPHEFIERGGHLGEGIGGTRPVSGGIKVR